MPHSEKPAATAAVEYNVYVYHPADTEERSESWFKTRTTNNPKRAVAEAERLHASRKYQKVEIKKKVVEGAYCADTVYKVYTEQKCDYTALKEITFLSILFVFGIMCVGYFIGLAGG